MPRAQHLEVMIGGCPAAVFAEVREFLESRGFQLSESRHGTVLRLWADRVPAPKRRLFSIVRDDRPFPGLSEEESQLLRTGGLDG